MRLQNFLLLIFHSKLCRWKWKKIRVCQICFRDVFISNRASQKYVLQIVRPIMLKFFSSLSCVLHDFYYSNQHQQWSLNVQQQFLSFCCCKNIYKEINGRGCNRGQILIRNKLKINQGIANPLKFIFHIVVSVSAASFCLLPNSH